MKKQHAFILFFVLAMAFFSSAQETAACDSIFLRDGSLILGQVKQLSSEQFWYVKCADTKEEVSRISADKVAEIVYRGGKVERFFNNKLDDTFREMEAMRLDTTRVYWLEMTDGNEYTGRYISQTRRQLVIQTDNLGVITLPKITIRKIRAVQDLKTSGGKYWFENPHATRYFFAPNGYNLRKGEGYYQNAWVLLNQVSYGITDNISIGGGTVPIFLFGANAFPVWLTPKVSFPIKEDRFNVGAGVFAMKVFGSDFESNGGFGIAYGTATLGSRNNNTTFGIGYGFADGDWASTPLVTFSGMYRLSRKGFLITENYLFPGGGDSSVIILSVGGRWVGRRIAIDYGLLRPFFRGDELGFIGLPWLSITAPFGQ